MTRSFGAEMGLATHIACVMNETAAELGNDGLVLAVMDGKLCYTAIAERHRGESGVL